MTNYISKQQYAIQKARLTRVQNKLRKVAPEGITHQRAQAPDDGLRKALQAVIDEVNRTFKEWQDGNYAFPDDWHRWNIARSDAEIELRFVQNVRYFQNYMS